MIHPALYTAPSAEKGWGVFTKEFLPTDSLIEISPVVVMTADERKLLDQTRLFDYIFEWEGDRCCMAMGLIPVYNHAYRSNCEYFQDYEEETIFIKTVRDVEPGEELTINYNGDFDDARAVWFDAKP